MESGLKYLTTYLTPTNESYDMAADTSDVGIEGRFVRSMTSVQAPDALQNSKCADLLLDFSITFYWEPNGQWAPYSHN